ncbi:MAG TPA: GNAT family N-acetyltransferase, partial [Sphaerochaeta sp.]|nr:GNAT family N-acetyltransferase [Sphaerochaeta sp.]
FVEGQGVPEAIDFDGQDGSSGHILLFDTNIPVGTTRIRKTDKGMKLERIAVLPAYRKKGYGGLLVKAALSKVTGTIYINAQVASLGFYEHLGFVQEDKTTFLEAGIPHTVMLWPHGQSEALCPILEP